ncbi:hypothetical protein KEM48_005491 [Puccinia striiformis f. sp. tritici PST-130]|nr:hypothetical protein KEM48_005491 [Puccinia striiformis f. sp. tritici PST-130]
MLLSLKILIQNLTDSRSPPFLSAKVKDTNNSRNPSPTPSSELSSLSSDSEYEDLVENQPTAQPSDGQLITSNQWVPIATSGASSNTKKNRKNYLLTFPSLNFLLRFIKDKTIYLLTATFPKKLFYTMGAHLRNGRNISEEQQRRELELQSRYPISPAAAERIRRIRAQSAASTRLREDILQAGSDRLESGSIPQRCEHVGDLTSASIQRFDPSASSYRQASVEPLPVYGTAVNPYPDHREQTDEPRRDSDERRDSSRDPSDDDGRRRIRSPFRNRQVYAGPPMAPVRTSQASGERTLDENGYQSSHLDARVTDQPRRSRGDDQTQRGMVSSRRVDLPQDFTSRSYESNHPDASTKPSRADGSVDPSHPYGNPHTSVQPHQFQRGNNPTNNPSRAPRTRRQTPDITFLGRTHSVTREPLLPPHPPQIQPPTLHQVYQEQPVIIRPAMHPQTYANPAYQPPINQQPYYPQHPHPYAPHPQPHGQGCGRGWRRTDPTMRMVRMGASFERVERALGRMNRIRGRGRGGRNPPYPQYQNQAHPQ